MKPNTGSCQCWVSSLHKEFRRIYGVVFRTLLHAEATVYLLILGTANLLYTGLCSGLEASNVCSYDTYSHKQTNYDQGARKNVLGFYFSAF